MQTQTILVAIFSLCGVALGAGLQFLFGRALETRRQFTLQRSQSYIDYFKVVALIAQNGRSKENLSMAADAKVRICIYASAAVIKRLSEFEVSGANTGAQEGRAIMLRLLDEMRRDVGKDDHAVSETSLQDVLFGVMSRTPGS